MADRIRGEIAEGEREGTLSRIRITSAEAEAAATETRALPRGRQLGAQLFGGLVSGLAISLLLSPFLPFGAGATVVAVLLMAIVLFSVALFAFGPWITRRINDWRPRRGGGEVLEAWATRNGLSVEDPAPFHARLAKLGLPVTAAHVATGRLPLLEREGSVALCLDRTEEQPSLPFWNLIVVDGVPEGAHLEAPDGLHLVRSDSRVALLAPARVDTSELELNTLLETADQLLGAGATPAAPRNEPQLPTS